MKNDRLIKCVATIDVKKKTITVKDTIASTGGQKWQRASSMKSSKQ